MKNDILWSEIAPGFEELDRTTPPRIPRSTPPWIVILGSHETLASSSCQIWYTNTNLGFLLLLHWTEKFAGEVFQKSRGMDA